MPINSESEFEYSKPAVIPTAGYLDDMPYEDIKNLFLEVLYNRVHGFCLTISKSEQLQGSSLSEKQIINRMQILKNYAGWVRSFSTTEGNTMIPHEAKKNGLKTLVGVDLGKDKKKNRREIQELIKLAKDGLVDIAAIGNEVLSNRLLDERELLEYMENIRQQIPGIPLGYADRDQVLLQQHKVLEKSDVILCNCYPYLEGTEFNNSFRELREKYKQVQDKSSGKKVIISETGWPAEGEKLGDSEPSHINAMKYFLNTQLWANDEDIDVFYYSSFDDTHKETAGAGPVTSWGIWNQKNKLKCLK